MQMRILALGAALAAGGHAAGQTQFFTDPGFLDDTPHTLIDFETDKDGNPIVLDDGEAGGLLGSFFNKQGILFASEIIIGNPTGDADAALIAGGSPENRMGFEDNDGSSGIAPIDSADNPFHTFGIFIMEHVPSASSLAMELRTFEGGLIDSVAIDESILVDQIGDIRFGFIGFETTEPVAFVGFRTETFFSYGFDDLRFAVVPSPGAAPLLVGACAFGVVRRRRR